MKKSIIAAAAGAMLTALAALPAEAAVRYVSTAGSDSNSGSMSAPFRSIQKCATTVRNGDTCLVGAGVYRETVTPNSGVTIIAASGASVTVDGSDPVSGWSLHSGQIYKAMVSGSGDAVANQVFVGGTMIEEARFPNTGSDVMKPNWAIMDTGSNNTTIVDNTLQNINWLGATVHWWAGTNPYGQLTATVTGSSTNRVTFTAPWPSRCPVLCPRSGGKFFIVGKLAALDVEREWFFDNATNMLYVWAPGGGVPNGVAIKRREWAFNLNGKSNVKIIGVKIFSAGISTDAASTDNLIQGIDAKYISHYIRHDDPDADFIKTGDADYGILLKGRGNTLKDSNIQFSIGSGVVIDGNNQTVTNNLIRNIDYSGTYGAGIYILPTGSGHVVTYNTVAKVGRAGITISGYNADTGERLTNSTIAYNNVYGHNMLSVDSGGIYICCQVDGSETEIHHNWVYDDRNTEGLGFKSAGIFFDNSSQKFFAYENMLWKNVGAGIKVNGEEKVVANLRLERNSVFAGADSIGVYNTPSAPGTRIENNRVHKPVYVEAGTAAAGIVVANNSATEQGATKAAVGCNIATHCSEGETPPQ